MLSLSYVDTYTETPYQMQWLPKSKKGISQIETSYS